MNRPAFSRRLHKWLALFVGLQMLVWAVSGFYMVVVNIDIIHGDMLVRNIEDALGEEAGEAIAPTALIARYPQAESLALTSLMGKPIYVIKVEGARQSLDAKTGDPLPPLTAESVGEIARYYYAGTGRVKSIEQLAGTLPQEIQFLQAPVWRVDFDDYYGSTLYIDSGTGRVASRRHTLWRVFDFLWMLHIMDYDERENVNNSLLRIFSVLAVVFVGSGSWLAYFTFRRRAHRMAVS